MSIYDAVKKYFETTPQDVLDRDWAEIAPLNEIGPDVLEYGRIMRPYIEAYVFSQEVCEASAAHTNVRPIILLTMNLEGMNDKLEANTQVVE